MAGDASAADEEQGCEREGCPRPPVHQCDGCLDYLCHYHMHEYGACPERAPFVYHFCTACELEAD